MTLRVAETWFETIPFADGVTLVRELYVADWLRCNIWHVEGRDFDLVIDTGMGVSPLKKVIAELTDKPVKAIATHCHYDHMGGNHEFDCRLGHHAEKDIFASPNEHNTGGWKPFVRAETFTALPYEGFSFEQYQVTPAPLTGFLDEGDVLDLGDRHFAIYHLPGHSPGSITMHEKKTGILFSGDVIYDGDLFDTVYHSDREIYRDSLTRLREMKFSVIHGGHYPSFDQARLEEIVAGYLAGGNRITDAASWVDAQAAAG